ncbi:hypothetical protein [Kribbella sp. NPDC023855]|uniref:hypothetical protein n=1 Tax=Kribbella sp. NPDC023855 TaxID=3154698 RepID=UPI0034033D20
MGATAPIETNALRPTTSRGALTLYQNDRHLAQLVAAAGRGAQDLHRQLAVGRGRGKCAEGRREADSCQQYRYDES